jgi:DUF2075 family protein
MYIIYVQNIRNLNIKILGFASTMEKAKGEMIEVAKNFIIENEGKKKLDIIFQEENFDYSKLADGYYFVKKENTLDVYIKESNITKYNGWLGDYHNVENKCSKVEVYGFAEFDNNLLNPFIYVSEIPEAPKLVIKEEIKKKTDTIVRPCFEDVIKQLISTGFNKNLRKIR